MTAGSVDYPDVLDPAGSLELRTVKALERLATALEQIALQGEPVPVGHSDIPPQELAPFPPPVSVAPSAAFIQSRDLPPTPFLPISWQCPIHRKSKTVPAGVSSRTGKPYSAFMACSEPGCNEKPGFRR